MSPPNLSKTFKKTSIEYDQNSLSTITSTNDQPLPYDLQLLNQPQIKQIQSLPLKLYIGSLLHFPQDLEQLFLINGEKGKLLLSYPQDFSSIGLTEQKQILIHTLIQNQRLNKITRNFPPHEIFQFISLQFNSMSELSWELIIWALKSIQNDRMTPTEKILLSRIKEAFALKISITEWQLIIKTIREIAAQNNGWILLSQETNNYLPNLFISDYIDPVNNNPTILIQLDPKKYYAIAEDCQALGPVDQQLWEDFRDFVNEFFGANQKKYYWTSSMKISGQQQQNSLKKKKNNSGQLNYNGPQIPGGKYGFAMFLQLCGKKETFKNSSLGKLSMMVQEAIKRKIIVYHKTLLVKNLENIYEWQWNLNCKIQEISDFESFYLTVKDNQPLQQKFFSTLNLIKELILEQKKLETNSEGVPLAKIPKLLLSNGVILNYTEFGITKLKNLIGLIQDVIIENPASTQATARIQEKPVVQQFQQQQNIPKPNNNERIIMKIKKELKIQPVMNIETLYSKIPAKMNMDRREFQNFLEKYQTSLQIQFDSQFEKEQILILSNAKKQKLSEDLKYEHKNNQRNTQKLKFAYFFDSSEEDKISNIDWLQSTPSTQFFKSKSDPWGEANNIEFDNYIMKLN